MDVWQIVVGIVLFILAVRFKLIGLFFNILLAILSGGKGGGFSGSSSKGGGFGSGSSGGGGSSSKW